MLDDIRNPPNSDADGFPTQRIANVQNASAYQPRPPNGRALNIEVNGQRYAWRYTYPDADDNTLNNVFDYETLVVPTKTTVTRTIKAQDVAHSWWIPALGGKADAVPGHLNFTWFKIPEPGTFRGQCAELCGRNHADMIAKVVALEPARFKTWIETRSVRSRCPTRLRRSGAPRKPSSPNRVTRRAPKSHRARASRSHGRR